MKFLLRFCFIFTFSFLSNTVFAQLDDLMIVEFVDWNPGAGFQIKIYNPTNQTINLSGYTMKVYNNANTTPSNTTNLSGTIGPKSFILVGNSDICTNRCPSSCDITSSSAGVNGNDAVTLENGSNQIDAIGAIGGNVMYRVNNVSSGTYWHRIVRQPTNCLRYTTNNGGQTSWPLSTSTNVTGWNVRNVECLSDTNGRFKGFDATVITEPIPRDTTICLGNTIVFKSSENANWISKKLTPTLLASNTDSISITFNTVGRDTIIVGSGVCADYVSINVLDGYKITPPAQFEACQGTPIQLVGNRRGRWQTKYLSATGTIALNDSVLNYTFSSPGNYLILFGDGLCKDSIFYLIKSRANRFIDAPDTLEFCGNPGNFQLSAVGAPNNGSYEWSFLTPTSGSIVGSDTIRTVTLNITTPPTGNFFERVRLRRVLNGCESFDTMVVAIKEVAAIQSITPTQSICQGDTVRINTTFTQIGSTFRWLPTTGIIDTLNSEPLVAPQSTTTYFFIVERQGCTDTAEVTINVENKPVANAGVDTSVCIGESIQLQGSGGSVYRWRPAIGLSDTTIANPIASPTTTTTYRVIVGTTGCESVDSVTVEVLPLPNAFASATSSTICLGQSTTLSGTSGTIYRWSPSTGLDDSTLQNPTATPIVTTNYTLTTFNGNCSSTDQITITVNPPIAVDIINNDTTVCRGESFTLRVTGTADEYIWLESGTQTPIDSFTFISNQTQYYRVLGSANGCTELDSILVTVTGSDVTILGVDSICAGDSTQITVLNADSLVWLDDNSTNTSRFVTPQLTTDFSARVYKDTCVFTVTKQIAVLQNPFVEINFENSNGLSTNNVCENQSITLRGNTNGNRIFVMSGIDTLGIDTFSGNPLTVLDTFNFQLNFIDTTELRIVVENRLCSSIIDTIINVVRQPEISISPVNVFCESDNAIFTLDSLPEGATVLWNNGDTNDTTLYPALFGLEIIAEVDYFGCSKSDTTIIFPQPRPTASFQTSSIRGVVPHTINFINRSIGADGYGWDFGDTTFSLFESPSKTYLNPDTFTVTLTAINSEGCIDSSQIDVYLYEPFRIWIPNAFTPTISRQDSTNDFFNVVTTGATELSGIIYNRWGEKIYEWDGLDGPWWDGKFKGKDVQDGVYLYIIRAREYLGNKHFYKGYIHVLK